MIDLIIMKSFDVPFDSIGISSIKTCCMTFLKIIFFMLLPPINLELTVTKTVKPEKSIVRLVMSDGSIYIFQNMFYTIKRNPNAFGKSNSIIISIVKIYYSFIKF